MAISESSSLNSKKSKICNWHKLMGGLYLISLIATTVSFCSFVAHFGKYIEFEQFIRFVSPFVIAVFVSFVPATLIAFFVDQ